MATPIAVLLVEEDADVRVMTRALLEMSAFEVVAVESLGAAITMLEASAFDAVVVDLGPVPLDDRRWRELERVRSRARITPVGVMSTSPLPASVVREHHLAFALDKPAGSEEFLAAVARCVTLPPVSTAQQQALRSYFAHLERSEWRELAALVAEDVVYRVPGADARFSRAVVGRDAFRDLAQGTFANFRDARFAITSMRALPDGVIVRYDGSWRGDDGRRCHLPGCALFQFHGDTISEVGVRLDLRALQQAIAA